MQTITPHKKNARLGTETATVLASYGARTTWPSGFQIYQKGTVADGVSVVLRGHVILRNRIRTGRGFVPAIITPGEFHDGAQAQHPRQRNAIRHLQAGHQEVNQVEITPMLQDGPDHPKRVDVIAKLALS